MGRTFLSRRASWPLPAMLAVLVVVVCRPALWAQPPGHRSVSLGLISCAFTLLGSLGYWLTLVLSDAGLLHFRSRMGMREPSEQELAVADWFTRILCLLVAYGGVVLAAFAAPG
ncbi:MAG: hypothetical protein QM778_16765 [Myxococcales bacterium]